MGTTIARRLQKAGRMPAVLTLLALVGVPAGLWAGSIEESLGGSERFLTHVAVDKPIYRAGEIVRVRAILLDAFDRTPYGERVHGKAKILGPGGRTVAERGVGFADSVGVFAWEIPEGTAGGEYRVRIDYPSYGFTPAERTFDVRAYRTPRLRNRIEFLREGYGPGDEVTASLESRRAEGGIPEGAEVTAIARLDGEEIHRETTSIDARGIASSRFTLPGSIARGEGALTFVIRDGGTVENASKTLPILLQTVDLALYPEGGDLVAGLPGRVYFEARTPSDRPADIAGTVIDENGNRVAEFASEHEGRGRFTFTPEAGKRYALRIAEPSGIDRTFDLPRAREAGAVLEALSDRYAPGEGIRFRVHSNFENGSEELRLALCLREREVASARVPAGAGREIVLTPPEEVDGVLRATLYRGTVPVAERLVFRGPSREVRLAIEVDRADPIPGDPVRVTVTATDEHGNPIEGGVVGLTVTDDTVLDMIERRERAPRLPVMVYLEPEVAELADAHVYLDPENSEAPRALDLLLGTQGWRRFAFRPDRLEAFLARHEEAGLRVLAFRAAPKPEEVGELWRQEGGVGGAMDDRRAVPRAAQAPAEDPIPHAEGEGNEPDAGIAPFRPRQERQDMGARMGRMEGRLLDREKEKMDRWAADQLLRAYIRVYAHEATPDREPGERNDFTETIYWCAGEKTGEDGRVTMAFDLNDSVTTFRVIADAFDARGAVGTAEAEIESVRPFYLEPKLPLEVTAGDRIELPVSLVNGLSEADRAVLRVVIEGALEADFEGPIEVALPAAGGARRVLSFNVLPGNGEATVRLEGLTGRHRDRVTRTITVRPRGFPRSLDFGGMLEADTSVRHTFRIPESVSAGSLTSEVAVFPTPLGNLTAALEALLRSPNGCFEQASSTNYPLTMAQQYFLTHTGVSPALVADARGKLEEGYRRLVGFECSEKGYEWFGGDPGHEALTAYGLLEFTDMAQVMEVDPAMVERTRAWLLSRRDGEGGFLRNERALDSFGGAPKETTDAYIVWALVESFQPGLDREIAAVKDAAMESSDSYLQALAAGILARTGDAEGAAVLMRRLADNQNEAGEMDGAVTSITRSGGQALAIETTALAILAWLQDDAFVGNVERGMAWLCGACEGGRFGSTQSTVLALRAIVAYDAARARPKAAGELVLVLDGEEIGRLPFTPDVEGGLALPDVADRLTPGDHELELTMTGGARMPYMMRIGYHAETPASSEACALRIETRLTGTEPAEGESLEAVVTVRNVTDENLPMGIAIVGLPGGLEPRHDRLKELVDAGRIDFYEVRGREVVLYWRGFAAGGERELSLDLVAAVPGNYTGPASRAYLYYTDEHKSWVDGMTVTIRPAE